MTAVGHGETRWDTTARYDQRDKYGMLKISGALGRFRRGRAAKYVCPGRPTCRRCAFAASSFAKAKAAVGSLPSAASAVCRGLWSVGGLPKGCQHAYSR